MNYEHQYITTRYEKAKSALSWVLASLLIFCTATLIVYGSIYFITGELDIPARSIILNKAL